jgi:transforming growth factor-beta-induced protein
VKYADATVTAADVAASNGVVHVIDKVVLPPTIVDIAQGTGSHTILVEALTKADLVDALKGTGPFTVFAPTDDAFTAALSALGITKQQLLDKADLADILKYHVLSGKTESSALSASQSVPTVQGASVTITKDGSAVKYADATVTLADVVASNGIVHVIDKVALPPAGSKSNENALSHAHLLHSGLAFVIVTGAAVLGF